MSATDFMGGLRRGEMAADNFTLVANAVARNRRLSYAAKGLFLNLAGHAANFRITEEFLASQSTDGLKVVRRLLCELRAAGYIYRGERSRYPKGTRNADGKDISGALGPYTWFVTDRPEEIALILTQYAIETAGGDNRPDGEVVPTSVPDAGADQGGQPPVSAGSDDQGKQGVSAGGDNRPKPTGGSGSSKEDQAKKTMKKKSGGRAAAPRTPADEITNSPQPVVVDQLNPVGNPPHACAEQEPGTRDTHAGDEDQQVSGDARRPMGFESWGVGALLNELGVQAMRLNDTTGQEAFAASRRQAALRQECRRRGMRPETIEQAEFGTPDGDIDGQGQELALVGAHVVTTRTGKTRTARCRRRR